MLKFRIFRLLWISALFFILSLAPIGKVFSASIGSQIKVGVEVAPIMFLSLTPQNQLFGITNTENELTILEKTSAGQELYHPASEEVFFNPFSTYTLVSEI